jgi:UDP-3-O-[3-hydroxymyristoyl] glucosamine N-acyltransferase
VIEAGVSIGEHCVIGAGCFIGHDTLIGARSRLFAHVTIYHGCTLGAHCRVQSGTVIGGEGFGYARGPEGWQRINQVGGVVIGDRVEIGANTAIDRGAIGDTVIEEGVILDNLIQIAHNVRIGRNTAIAACTGIAGSANVGSECTIGGSVNINGHIHIVDKVHITATSFVIRSITEPGQYSSGMLLEKNSKWRRTAARLTQLDAMASKLRRL